MKITKASFVISNSDYRKCPPGKIPEFAFIGRSNVGKSSLINMLCGAKNLAKTSSKPGKTQLINHFIINTDQWYIVDLPGYGYAKTAKTSRDKWQVMIADYLCKSENLYTVFVLIDSRLEPQKIDMEFIDWLGEKGIPFALVFTKIDKNSINQTSKNVAAFKRKMLETWEELPPVFLTSSTEGKGKDDILNYVESVLTN